MSLLDSFIHGDALTEIFIEGHNPHALSKLAHADLDALRQQVHSRETLQAYVIGRIVGSGRGLWAVTDEAVYLRDDRRPGVQRIPLAEVRGFEAVRGRFGHVVRLEAQGRGWSLFGVDRGLAGQMHDAFGAKGLTGAAFDDRPARSHLWRESAPEGWAQECVQDARRRLHAA